MHPINFREHAHKLFGLRKRLRQTLGMRDYRELVGPVQRRLTATAAAEGMSLEAAMRRIAGAEIDEVDWALLSCALLDELEARVVSRN